MTAPSLTLTGLPGRPRSALSPRAGQATPPPCPGYATTPLSTKYIRQAAIEVIAAGWHDDPATLAWLRDQAASDEYVRQAAADTDQYVRQAAVEAITAGWHDNPGTLPWLRDRAATDTHGTVRQAAMLAITAGWHDDPGTLPWLRNLAADKDDIVRQAAVEAIAAGWPDESATVAIESADSA